MTLWALGHPLLSDDKGTAIPNEDKNLEEVAIYIICPGEWNVPRNSFALQPETRYVKYIQRCLHQQYTSGFSSLCIHEVHQFLGCYGTNVSFCSISLFVPDDISHCDNKVYQNTNLITLKLKVWETKFVLSLHIAGWRCAIYVFVTMCAFGSKMKHTID